MREPPGLKDIGRSYTTLVHCCLLLPVFVVVLFGSVFKVSHYTQGGGLRDVVPDLKIRYKTSNSRGTKVDLFCFANLKGSTSLPKGGQSWTAMQETRGKEASSPPSSAVALLRSDSFAACVMLIPRKLRFASNFTWRACLPRMQQRARGD